MREQRLKQIIDYLEEEDACHLDTLCEKFNVSKVTIRRDVDTLSKMGKITKIYGGIKLVGEQPPMSSFHQRDERNAKEKDKIGRLCAALVEDGDTIFIDAGTTAYKTAKYLENKKVCIVTNNLYVFEVVREKKHVSVIYLGGEFLAVTNSLVGDIAVDNLSKLNITKAFITPASASIEAGYSNMTLTETKIKSLAMKCSMETILAIDSSKWGRQSAISFADIGDVDLIVTDKEPPEEYKNYFSKKKIPVKYEFETVEF